MIMSFPPVPLILSDSSDSSSLLAMAQQARVVLNCVGPYRFYGEAVVEACVEAGAHHLDISGEPQYLEKMQLKYHQVSSYPYHIIITERKVRESNILESSGKRSLCHWCLWL